MDLKIETLMGLFDQVKAFITQEVAKANARIDEVPDYTNQFDIVNAEFKELKSDVAKASDSNKTFVDKEMLAEIVSKFENKVNHNLAHIVELSKALTKSNDTITAFSNQNTVLSEQYDKLLQQYTVLEKDNELLNHTLGAVEIKMKSEID